MIEFTKPINLNGAELIDELKAANIDVIGWPKVDSDRFFLDISKSDETKAIAVVAAHNGTIIAPEPTVKEKLASVGLNLDDVKEALGL